MKVLVAGDRNMTDDTFICQQLLSNVSKTDDTVIYRISSPFDIRVALQAAMLGIKTEEYTLDHEGNAHSGEECNDKMIQEGKPSKVLILHDYIFNSRMSKDLLLKAAHAGIEVHVARRR